MALLKLIQPTAELIAQLPVIAAKQWETRKARIAKDAERLSKRLADQATLNRKAIQAKIDGVISPEDFKTIKDAISAEEDTVREQIKALDAERSGIEDLMAQAKVQMLNFVASWENANIGQKQEIVKSLFPDGLPYSDERKFFEPGNSVLRDYQLRWLEGHLLDNESLENIGAGDGI